MWYIRCVRLLCAEAGPMTARKSAALRMCSLYVALAMAALWPIAQAFATESLSNSFDLAEVHEFSDDPDQVLKTWENGYVFVPGFVISEFIYGKMGSPSVQSRLDELPNDVRYPLIVFLHDARGFTGKVRSTPESGPPERRPRTAAVDPTRTLRCRWREPSTASEAVSSGT